MQYSLCTRKHKIFLNTAQYKSAYLSEATSEQLTGLLQNGLFAPDRAFCLHRYRITTFFFTHSLSHGIRRLSTPPAINFHTGLYTFNHHTAGKYNLNSGVPILISMPIMTCIRCTVQVVTEIKTVISRGVQNSILRCKNRVFFFAIILYVFF